MAQSGPGSRAYRWRRRRLKAFPATLLRRNLARQACHHSRGIPVFPMRPCRTQYSVAVRHECQVVYPGHPDSHRSLRAPLVKQNWKIASRVCLKTLTVRNIPVGHADSLWSTSSACTKQSSQGQVWDEAGIVTYPKCISRMPHLADKFLRCSP